MGKKSEEYILITSSNFPSGGPGASYLYLFCRGLKINGAKISVYLLKGNAFGNYRYNGPRHAVTIDDIPYTYLGFKQRPVNIFLKLIDQLVSFARLHVLLLSLIIRNRNSTILLYNSDLFFNLPTCFISKIWGMRIVKFAAEIIDKSQYSPSLLGKISHAGYMMNFKYLNKISDKLIVFSHYLKEEFLKMGVEEDKIIIQPNLTDFEFWHHDNVEIKYTIGYSGAPYKKDGLSDLLKAIHILSSRDVDVSLIIAGDATFGRTLIPGLKEECNRLGISQKVIFTGLISTPEVKDYLSRCMVLAITRPDTVQTRAGFPTKLGEYFALKKPVLSTRFGDMERYFKDGVDLVYAECDHPDSIADRLEWMINHRDEIEIIAERGYTTASQLLDFTISMKHIMLSLAQ
jgi:glycosyltransferase involved in cell wall biosynthesis